MVIINNILEEQNFFSNFPLENGGFFTFSRDGEISLVFVKKESDSFLFQELILCSSSISDFNFYNYLLEKKRNLSEFFCLDDTVYSFFYKPSFKQDSFSYEIEFVTFSEKEAVKYCYEYFYLSQKIFNSRNVVSD